MDAATLAAFAARTFHETYDGLIEPADIAAYVSANYGPALQAAELDDPESVTLLAETSGAFVAFAQIVGRVPPAFVTDPEPVELSRIYVDRRWQGRGLAAALLTAVRNEAAARGARSIWLQVWEKNPRAIRFYGKHGFRDAGAAPFIVGSEVQNDRVMVARVEAGPG